MSTMRASLIIEARDKASAVFGKIAAKSRDMGKAFQPVTKEAKQADKAMDAAGRSAQAMALKMKIAEKAGFGLGTAIGWTGRQLLNMAKWGAIGAITGVGALAVGVIKVGAKFEQFQAQLEGTEGSAEGAKKALSWVSKFAATTPYELDQVTEAFVRARNLGIDPYNGAMTSLGDAAAGSNKTLMEAVEALADAQTFQFERLREFGVTTSSKGSEVTFSFRDKGGKAAMRTVKKDAVEIEKALLGIWDGKFAGGMIRQSKTLVGLWSNIKDTANGFLYRVAQGGIFDRLKNGAASFLEQLNRWADDGTLDKYANDISDALEEMYDWGKRFVSEANWQQVGSDIKNVAMGAWDLVKALAWVVRLMSSVASLQGSLNSGQNRAQAWIGANFNGRPEQRASWQNRLDSLNANEAAHAKRAKPGYQSDQFRKVRGGRNAPITGRSNGSKVAVGGAVEIRVKTDKDTRASFAKMVTRNPSVPMVGKVQPA